MAWRAAKHITTLKVITVKGRCPSEEAKSSKFFGQKIQNLAKKEFKKPLESYVVVEIDLFYYGERNRPDVDNVLKLILDSLKGIAFNDDKQIVNSKSNVHDTSEIMKFENQPIFLIQLLMQGIMEYAVIRIHEK